MLLLIVLLVLDAVFLIGAAVFTYESIREKEPRAPKVGLVVLVIGVGLAALILFVPVLRWAVAILFGLITVVGLVFIIPGKPNQRVLEGASGYLVGEAARVDERDIVFARNRSIRPGSDQYREYYAKWPDREEGDAKRREMGGPVGRPGLIDHGHPPNVSMVGATFAMPAMLGPHAEPQPPVDKEPAQLPPERASEIIKGFARHLGADLVGICRVNSLWAYSHRGEIFYDNWEEWGTELPDPLPYAVVIATEMDLENVGAGPHTPAVVESGANYAKGAFITTVLAGWFAGMGYKASAQHSRHYDTLVVPLAVDAGLGEMGRFGYLITNRLGPRARIFATMTDMPLVPDKPIDLGAEEFCRVCKKCAISCPSRSIPEDDMKTFNGAEKWKLNEETCFDYWGKIGTDCSICMGVCPYSRPDRSVHKIIRAILRRSRISRKVFPHVDNFIYGQKWKRRPPMDWIDYRK
jgi:reductive dehalogenase